MPTMNRDHHRVYLAGQGGEGIDVTPDGHRSGADGRVRRGGSVRTKRVALDRAGGEDRLASLPALFGVPVVLAESCPICGVVPDSIHVHDLSIPEVLPARWPA